MFRHEPDGGHIFVRYDGTETRVDIRRGKEGRGLTTAELAELVDVLRHALGERHRFEGVGPERTPEEAMAHGLGAQDG